MGGNGEMDFVAERDISGHSTGGAVKAGGGGCGVARGDCGIWEGSEVCVE